MVDRSCINGNSIATVSVIGSAQPLLLGNCSMSDL